MTDSLRIIPGKLTLSDLRRIWRAPLSLSLDPMCLAQIEASAATVDRVVAHHKTVYGINTGFGLLAKTRIPQDKLKELQRNLVLSHAAGIGALLDDSVVRLILVLKAAGLGLGYSGVRQVVVDALLALANAGVYPCLPAKGSVGASGDLAPLAHLSAVLIGVGEARIDGRIVPAAEGLRRAGIEPLELGPKEGLALLNGTQVSTALALVGLFQAEDAFMAAVVAGAMSVDGAAGSDTPFDPRIHAVRGHKGQIDVAALYRELLRGSAIRESHRDNDDRVQDPYSLRCQPQVMGACLDHLRFAASVLLIEANAVSDNPLVFAAQGEVLSGGNFHAEPVAMASDTLALSIAEIGALSERRLALLIDPQMSGLPAFLIPEGGINSGFMITQVTAAALASENKSLAHPASVDSLPTSANQEDHVSMATFAARRLTEMAENTAGIIAIELMAAAQAIDLRRPLTTSESLARAHALIRDSIPFHERDRYLAPDIAKSKALVQSGAFNVFQGGIALPSF